MESGALGREAAALRIIAIARVSCSFLVVVVVAVVVVVVVVVVTELDGQCSVNIGLRQGWLGDDARGCLDPGARRSNKCC